MCLTPCVKNPEWPEKSLSHHTGPLINRGHTKRYEETFGNSRQRKAAESKATLMVSTFSLLASSAFTCQPIVPGFRIVLRSEGEVLQMFEIRPPDR